MIRITPAGQRLGVFLQRVTSQPPKRLQQLRAPVPRVLERVVVKRPRRAAGSRGEPLADPVEVKRHRSLGIRVDRQSLSARAGPFHRGSVGPSHDATLLDRKRLLSVCWRHVRPSHPPARAGGEIDVHSQPLCFGHGVVVHVEPRRRKDVNESVFLSLHPVDPNHSHVAPTRFAVGLEIPGKILLGDRAAGPPPVRSRTTLGPRLQPPHVARRALLHKEIVGRCPHRSGRDDLFWAVGRGTGQIRAPGCCQPCCQAHRQPQRLPPTRLLLPQCATAAVRRTADGVQQTSQRRIEHHW